MTGICHCLRSGGFGYSSDKTAPIIWACTPGHLDFARSKETDMPKMEQQAEEKAVETVGEYLEHLGGDNIANLRFVELTPEQFAMLVHTAIAAYRDEMARLSEPF